MKKLPDIQQILKLLNVSDDSPSGLVWKVSLGNKIKNGSVAGCLSKHGYFQIKINKSIYKVHRIVYYIHSHDFDQSLVVDHLDGNRQNNSINNLRLCTTSENCRNTKKSARNSSGIVGISLENNNGYEAYRVGWVDENGVYQRKLFSVLKYGGKQSCFEIAKNFRDTKMKYLIQLNIGWTIRHGT